MATTSVSLLHSGGLIPVIPGLGGALYFANEVLRDDVALTPTLSSYDHLHFRNYEGSIYESTASISSKVNTIDKKIKYDYSREVFSGLHGKLLYHETSSSEFAPMIGAGLSPEELEAEAIKGDEDNFAYNITWKYHPKENGEWWWRSARHFQMTLSNWKNQQMSCDEYYPETSAYFTTETPIKRGDRTGGIIEALPYQSLFGRINLGANTKNAGMDFQPINKR